MNNKIEQKDSFYNYELCHDVRFHYTLTIFQNIFIATFVTGLMQMSSSISIYLMYCSPVYFLLVLLEIIFWYKRYYLNWRYTVCHVVWFVICFPIFFAVYFSIFYQIATFELTQATNCSIIGVETKPIQDQEIYSILYINFEYDGQQYLGAGCSSDQNQGSLANSYYPYGFEYYGFQFSCSSDDQNDDSQDEDNNSAQNVVIVEQTSSQKTRILQDDGTNIDSYNTRPTFPQDDGNNGGGTTSNTCSQTYRWSRVKMPSWFCLERGFDLEKYMENQICYVNFYGGDKARQNGLERKPMRDMDDFPIISYSPHIYFPQDDLIVLICLTYYSWLISLNAGLQYSAQVIIVFYQRIQQKIEEKHRKKEIKKFPLPQQNQEMNDIFNQQLAANQVYLETQTEQSNPDLIIQQQFASKL